MISRSLFAMGLDSRLIAARISVHSCASVCFYIIHAYARRFWLGLGVSCLVKRQNDAAFPFTPRHAGLKGRKEQEMRMDG